MFVLSSTELAYFEDEGRLVRKGAIALNTVMGIDQGDLGFVIHTSSRDWVLYSVAKTPTDRFTDVTEWIREITSLLNPFSAGQRRVPVDDIMSDEMDTIKPLQKQRAVARSAGDVSSGTIGLNITSYVRKKVSQQKRRFTEGGFDLDLCYITDNLIAMGFPSQGMEGMYRNPIDHVQRFFSIRHPGHYKLYNLCSERDYDPAMFEGRVSRYPFDDHNPPKLSLVDEFCEDLHTFLVAHPDNAAAIHCKAGKGRTGTMISCYLIYSGMFETARESLQFYGEKRTKNGQGVTIPSQRRYVGYYERRLKGRPPFRREDPVITLPPMPIAPVFSLTRVRLAPVPSFDLGGGCDPFFKLYIDGTKIFDQSSKGRVKAAKAKSADHVIDLETSLPICGDCKFVFYDRDKIGADKMFSFWLNTAFLDGQPNVTVSLQLDELDGARGNKRNNFDPSFVVEVSLRRALGADERSFTTHVSDQVSEVDSVEYEEYDADDLDDGDAVDSRHHTRESQALSI